MRQRIALISPLLLSCVSFLMATSSIADDAVALGPRPGDFYREYATHSGGNRDWRVTDRKAVEKFERANDHLPNSRLQIEIDDLEHATRAEFMLDRWGGHRGTINKRVRFNEHGWIVVPEIANTPDHIRPEQLMYQDNPVVSLPLVHLKEGLNVFEGDCDEEGGFGWGQWGLYSMVVRIYYDRDMKAEHNSIDGQIVSPVEGSHFGESPEIVVKANAQMGVARIDVLASYDGYDENGDGVFDGFHESHFQLVSGQPSSIQDHVGTLWQKPYQIKWNTHWVPDQNREQISLIARIQDSRGYWSVTPPVNDLSLVRDDVFVKLYRANGVPEDFSVRVEETKSCTFEIPDTHDIDAAFESALHLRTWHGWDGHHDPIRINEHEMPVDGKNHFYDYDLLTFPPSALKQGTNVFWMHSKTEHHMLEVLWPGPAIVVRMPKPDVTITEDDYQDRPQFVVKTPAATYWLDQHSGGLSRLIDRDGNDWIEFKKEPWDEYPAAAASSFRGLPNLLFAGDDGGFGHPGWDRASSVVVDDQTILCKSNDGKWQIRWTFTPDDARLSIVTQSPDRLYWFLYEGPVAGRWAPDQQYFASETMLPTDQPRDYFKGERIAAAYRWGYVGDRRVPRVLAIAHESATDAVNTFSHLGNSAEGLQSPDGMVVWGFGRGEKGIDPRLKGNHSFRIALLEQSGQTEEQYKVISNQMKTWFSKPKLRD